MQHNPGLRRWFVHRVSHTPIIPDGVGEETAVTVERCSSNRVPDRRVGPEPRTRLAVPEDKGTIRAGSHEAGLLDRVKLYVVDRPAFMDVLAIGGVAMSPEGEIRAVEKKGSSIKQGSFQKNTASSVRGI